MNAANRLSKEKSPYLLQHAHNPVDWRPWGEEAFVQARVEDKPVFLSIGYAACHWCHVMERESFNDPETARALNDCFVCVKVDREERPDVDKAYMLACNLMIGRGGWPLNLILTPDKAPFFAATYIPRDSRFGYPGLLDLASQIKTLWREQRSEILASAGNVLLSLRQASQESATDMAASGQTIGADTYKAAYRALADSFDKTHAGFGQAPKFPSLFNLLFLLGVYQRFSYPLGLEMTEKTLSAMRFGGVFDHLGFGLHRYSIDQAWLVPHFEKMLYDQAMLLLTSAEAHRAGANPLCMRIAVETAEYVLRDMQSPEGAFYSAEDADSEGVEGKFYLFEQEEILQILGEPDGRLALEWFNCSPEGNFEDETNKEKTGANILHAGEHAGAGQQAFAQKHNLSLEQLQSRIEGIHLKLMANRLKRARPFKDDKSLADWSGLMIAALARAATVCQRPDWIEAAARAARFVLDRFKSRDGKLVHRYRDAEAGLPAHLDDYAFMAWGLFELAEADPVHEQAHHWRAAAIEFVDELLASFWDARRAGFFFTAEDQTELPVRPKEIIDGATPSGNAVALLVMARLGRSGDKPKYVERVSAMLHAFAPTVNKAPTNFPFLLRAAMEVDGESAG